MNRVLKLALLLALYFLLPSTKSRANHAAGGELMYEWISDSTWRFTFKFYRDCSGIAEPAAVGLCYFNYCNQIQPLSVNMPKSPNWPANGVVVVDECPAPFQSTCNGGTVPGYREFWYEATVTLPERCQNWTFYCSISARNNPTNVTGGNIYIQAELNNTITNPYNTSVNFTNKPVPYLCNNKPYEFNNGAYDVNGDSLVYSSIQPMISGACAVDPNNPPATVTYVNGFTLANPFATNNTYNVSTTTGAISFTSSQVQSPVVTIKVDEYRNGVWIGSVFRDIQMVVLSCPFEPTAMNIDPTSVSGANNNGGVFRVCPYTPMSFCFDITTPDTGAKLKITSNLPIIIPAASLNISGVGTPSTYNCFFWTPTALDTGLKTFTVTATDTSCRPPGIKLSKTYTFSIYVQSTTYILNDTAVCAGDSVKLQAVGGSQFTWDVLPGGDPTPPVLLTPNGKFVKVQPTMTTQYAVTSNMTNNVCGVNKDTVTVTVVTPFSLFVGNDTTVCNGTVVQLNPVVTPNTQPFTYAWVPNPNLSSTTIIDPTFTANASADLILEVSVAGVEACKAMDTIHIEVLPLDFSITADHAICKGASTPLNIAGDTRYTYTWTPATGLNVDTGQSVIATPDTTTTYTVTAEYVGCVPATRSVTVEVQPNPIVYAGADREVCQWDTVHLHTKVSPSWYTNYTYSWTPATDINDATFANPVITVEFGQDKDYIVEASTSAGCKGQDTVHITVHPGNFITDIRNDTTICATEQAGLWVEGGVSWNWSPAYGLDDVTSRTPTSNAMTTTQYTVVAKDGFGCKDTAEVTLTVSPRAVLELGADITLYAGETHQLNATGNCSSFSWFPALWLSDANIMNPVLTAPDNDIQYVVTGATENGCTTTDTLNIRVNPDALLELPNAFTPGSGTNNELKIIRRGQATLKSFRIYDRWGQEVFITSDIDKGWDGNFKGKNQPMGTYLFTIEAVTHTGRQWNKQGNITLIR
jgi:gliding motility-associated-like protein